MCQAINSWLVTTWAQTNALHHIHETNLRGNAQNFFRVRTEEDRICAMIFFYHTIPSNAPGDKSRVRILLDLRANCVRWPCCIVCAGCNMWKYRRISCMKVVCSIGSHGKSLWTLRELNREERLGFRMGKEWDWGRISHWSSDDTNYHYCRKWGVAVICSYGWSFPRWFKFLYNWRFTGWDVIDTFWRISLHI